MEFVSHEKNLNKFVIYVSIGAWYPKMLNSSRDGKNMPGPFCFDFYYIEFAQFLQTFESERMRQANFAVSAARAQCGAKHLYLFYRTL